MRKPPEIFIDGSDMTAEDGNMGEFIDYIEHFHNENDEAIEASKFQFKEFLDQPKRLHYPSYNNEVDKYNKDELKDFSIVESVEYEPKDLANENIPSYFNSKRAINNRKQNMFALPTSKHLDDDENNSLYRPVIRITPTEDERVEQFLQDENCEKINDAKDHCATEILIKSKTTQLFDCSDDNTTDVESFESDSRANSPPLHAKRRESLLSDCSDPIQFECKQSTDPNHFYNREDSSSSNKSNVLFERSQSRLSELEYIKGRDDWKDSYLSYDISEEIDSDNYHHLRRHSETADTLEYIRGREDWLRNELHHAHRNSLSRIFEMAEPKIVIQDEIDSDEYHHNFFQNETFCLVSAATEQVEKSFNNGRQICDFGENNHVNSTNDSDTKVTEWTENMAVGSNKQSSSVSPSNVIFNENNKITEAIEDLIIHESANVDDLEITVLDFDTSSDMLSDHTQNMYNPFIVISEATDGNQEIPIELNYKKTPNTLHPELAQIPKLFGNTDEIINTETIQTENTNQNAYILSTDTNKFLMSEIASETECRHKLNEEIDFQEKLEVAKVTQRNDRSFRAKSEMSQSLLKPTEQPPRRTLSFENVEDLIRDVSNGPFFHK